MPSSMIPYQCWYDCIQAIFCQQAQEPLSLLQTGYYIYWASIQVPFWHQFADWSGRR